MRRRHGMTRQLRPPSMAGRHGHVEEPPGLADGSGRSSRRRQVDVAAGSSRVMMSGVGRHCTSRCRSSRALPVNSVVELRAGIRVLGAASGVCVCGWMSMMWLDDEDDAGIMMIGDRDAGRPPPCSHTRQDGWGGWVATDRRRAVTTITTATTTATASPARPRPATGMRQTAGSLREWSRRQQPSKRGAIDRMMDDDDWAGSWVGGGGRGGRHQPPARRCGYWTYKERRGEARRVAGWACVVQGRPRCMRWAVRAIVSGAAVTEVREGA